MLLSARCPRIPTSRDTAMFRQRGKVTEEQVHCGTASQKLQSNQSDLKEVVLDLELSMMGFLISQKPADIEIEIDMLSVILCHIQAHGGGVVLMAFETPAQAMTATSADGDLDAMAGAGVEGIMF